MNDEECNCRCHIDKTTQHFMACCMTCGCGKHIKFEHWESHVEDCPLAPKVTYAHWENYTTPGTDINRYFREMFGTTPWRYMKW